MKDNKVKNKKIRKVQGIVSIYIQSTLNNTKITAADSIGNVIATSSAGSAGFKGTRKSTPFAAQIAIENLNKKLKLMGVSSVKIFMKGFGSGRESVVKGMQEFNVLELVERSVEAHNGVRLRKARRS